MPLKLHPWQISETKPSQALLPIKAVRRHPFSILPSQHERQPQHEHDVLVATTYVPPRCRRRWQPLTVSSFHGICHLHGAPHRAQASAVPFTDLSAVQIAA